jgi:SAM-dependent methyltransferase
MYETEIETNRRAWDVRTREHVGSRFYDVEGFLAGNSSLKAIERAALGDVAGLRLLHLQCHFGLDTLSLARLGAHATGVDFSPEAIAQANDLARRTQLAAEFALCDVYATPDTVGGGFDRVFTSYGAIEWLPDIGRWARVVADCLRPGGRFHLVEFHPCGYALQGDPYFHSPVPMRIEERSYTENATEVVPLHVWTHPLGDVVNALIRAGLRIESLNEFPWSPYDCFPGLVEREPGRFYRDAGQPELPMVYSISASKG